MSRSGRIVAINPKQGMVAIETNDDGHTIFELVSEFEIEVGDEIRWSNDYGMGHENYSNVTKGITKEVYVQNHSVSKSNVRQQLLL